MGDRWEGQRNEYPNDNNHLHHPPTTHPTKGHTILQHVDVVHPWAPSRHAPDQYMLRWMPIIDTKDTIRPLRHLPGRCEPFVYFAATLSLYTARKGTFSSMPYHPTQDNNTNINTTTAVISKGYSQPSIHPSGTEYTTVCISWVVYIDSRTRPTSIPSRPTVRRFPWGICIRGKASSSATRVRSTDACHRSSISGERSTRKLIYCPPRC